MKLTKYFKIVAVLLCMSASLTAKAATDHADITLSHTYEPYVNFTGTAPGASRFYDNDDVYHFIFPVRVNLGTMGLESNTTGDCDLNFSTVNNFKLRHTVSNQTLSKYRVLYRGYSFSRSNNPELTIPCNTTPTALDFILTGWSLAGYDGLIPAGIYRDIITVTVTTQ